MTRFQRQSIKLAGTERLYRIRIGDYRIVYGVDKTARACAFIAFDIAERSIVEFEESGERVQFETRLLELANPWVERTSAKSRGLLAAKVSSALWGKRSRARSLDI